MYCNVEIVRNCPDRFQLPDGSAEGCHTDNVGGATFECVANNMRLQHKGHTPRDSKRRLHRGPCFEVGVDCGEIDSWLLATAQIPQAAVYTLLPTDKYNEATLNERGRIVSPLTVGRLREIPLRQQSPRICHPRVWHFIRAGMMSHTTVAPHNHPRSKAQKQLFIQRYNDQLHHLGRERVTNYLLTTC